MRNTTRAAMVVAGSLAALAAAVAPAQAATSASAATEPVPAQTLPAPADGLTTNDLNTLLELLKRLGVELPL